MALFKFTKNILENKKIDLYNNGKHHRDFTYVGDVVKANILASKSQKVGSGEVINIGSGRNIAINTVASMIGKSFEYKPALKEPFANLASINKAKKLLNWENIL